MAETQLIDIKADLRERLLYVAIRLFAEHGIEAVSLRTINAEAGTKNKSAVHYHFGSKDGIIEAVFVMLDEKLSPIFLDLIERVEQRAESSELSVPEIVTTLCVPFFMLRSQTSIGPYLIKLFSKMMIDKNPEYQRLFNQHFRPYVERIYELMKRQLPGKPDHLLRFHLMHGSMATILGVATIDLMDNTPLGDIRFESELEMMLSYIDYFSGGVSSSQSSLEQIDIQFWQDYAQEVQGALAARF